MKEPQRGCRFPPRPLRRSGTKCSKGIRTLVPRSRVRRFAVSHQECSGDAQGHESSASAIAEPRQDHAQSHL